MVSCMTLQFDGRTVLRLEKEARITKQYFYHADRSVGVHEFSGEEGERRFLSNGEIRWGARLKKCWPGRKGYGMVGCDDFIAIAGPMGVSYSFIGRWVAVVLLRLGGD